MEERIQFKRCRNARIPVSEAKKGKEEVTPVYQMASGG
jgi:hypothetical protein